MLIGLLAPTAGTIEVDGIDVIRDPRRVRDHIGYMGQKVSLYQGLSLRENVEFYAGLYGLDGARARASAGARCASASRSARPSASSPRTCPPASASAPGSRSARCTSRACSSSTSRPPASTCTTAALFWELIQDEAARGVTVFVTTHFLEEVDYCDWVCFIDAGRLIADATPEELRRRFSDGYRITLDAPPDGAPRRRARARRRRAPRATTPTTARWHRRSRALDADAARARSSELARDVDAERARPASTAARR